MVPILTNIVIMNQVPLMLEPVVSGQRSQLGSRETGIPAITLIAPWQQIIALGVKVCRGYLAASDKVSDRAGAKKSDEHENTAKDGTKLTADQSHEEIISGRDSAYFSLTFTSASESENEESHSKICDEHRASFKSALTPPPIATSTLIKKDKGCQTEPKKNVTLLLPDTRSPSKPFGVHLQTQTVKICPPLHDTRYLPDGDSSWQMDTIFQVAKVHLVSNFPKFNLSINIIFTPSRKQFSSLSSSTIGNLMFDLNRILFSPQLPHIVTWEVSLFTIIKFLCHLVSYLTVSTGLCLDLDISCVKYFHNCRIKDFTDYRTEKILTKVQQEFIQIWMCLLLQ